MGHAWPRHWLSGALRGLVRVSWRCELTGYGLKAPGTWEFSSGVLFMVTVCRSATGAVIYGTRSNYNVWIALFAAERTLGISWHLTLSYDSPALSKYMFLSCLFCPSGSSSFYLHMKAWARDRGWESVKLAIH